jgi:hypothetical protein
MRHDCDRNANIDDDLVKDRTFPRLKTKASTSCPKSSILVGMKRRWRQCCGGADSADVLDWLRCYRVTARVHLHATPTTVVLCFCATGKHLSMLVTSPTFSAYSIRSRTTRHASFFLGRPPCVAFCMRAYDVDILTVASSVSARSPNSMQRHRLLCTFQSLLHTPPAYGPPFLPELHRCSS